jgi:GDP-4-dehydro-6-deoxy-D-mannose reductase
MAPLPKTFSTPAVHDPNGNIMAVLVTGAEGFIGSHLVEHLLAQGKEVIGTTFDTSVLWRLEDVKDLIQMVPMDVRDAERVDEVMSMHRPEAVYHLAAQSLPTVSWDEPVRTMETNANGTVNIIEALRRHSPEAPVLVACSSAEYGMVSPDEVPTPEDHPLLPLHPYGVSKVAQDLLAYQYHYNFDVKAFRARIFNTTGPRKEADVLADFTKRVVDIEQGRGPPRLRVGNLEPQRDFTDVRDNVRALTLMVERGRPGVAYNICTGNVHRISDLLDVILSNTKVQVEVYEDPELMRPSDEPIIAGSNARLVGDTGWRPEVPIEGTIVDMLEFWRGHLG